MIYFHGVGVLFECTSATAVAAPLELKANYVEMRLERIPVGDHFIFAVRNGAADHPPFLD